MAQTRAWRIVEAAGREDLYGVFECLRDGTNPNFAYVGVTPLQMALENGDPDITAILLHWQARVEQNTASKAGGAGYATGENAKQLNARMIKECKKPELLAKHKLIKAMMEDAEVLKKHVDSIQGKIEEQRILYQKARFSRKKRYFMVSILVVMSLISLHAMLAFQPQLCADVLHPRFVSDVLTYSPVFLGQNPFVPPRPLRPGNYKYCTVLDDRKTVVPLGVKPPSGTAPKTEL
mmetsp:Transcript_7386/g.18441  ORF Transcript_7386/g.18441 Transcript_7386/m.18441 type:complete len:235 (+) Transcript_7386:164-868(+)